MNWEDRVLVSRQHQVPVCRPSRHGGMEGIEFCHHQHMGGFCAWRSTHETSRSCFRLVPVSPDGSLVSFGTNGGQFGDREIWLMGPNGEQARKLQEASEKTGISEFGWLPDAKQYAYILTDASGDKLLSRDTAGGSPVTLFQASELTRVNDFVFLQDGRVLFSLTEPGSESVCNYWTMRLDPGTGRHIEEPKRLTNWPSFCVASGA